MRLHRLLRPASNDRGDRKAIAKALRIVRCTDKGIAHFLAGDDIILTEPQGARLAREKPPGIQAEQGQQRKMVNVTPKRGIDPA